MTITKEHIQFSIHFAFHLKKNAAEATAMICAAYGENAERQKEGRWVPHELSEDNKNRRRDTALTLQSSGKKIFCTKLLQAMKSGFFMITLNVENHGLTLVNLRHRRQSPISTPRRFCSVSGEIGKVCCITSCYNRVKQSRQTATNNN
ncbi:hypothetical protein P5V15_002694 [Pogonomyrmex californicus]